MTGMSNAAAMSQMVRRDHGNMGLIHGAKSGYLNRDEFVNLGNYANETERMRGLYNKGGLNPRERMLLGRRQKSYDRMYQRYSYGNYHPRTYARDGVQGRQINQLNRIYGGARSGELTGREGLNALREQKGISYQKGVYQRGRFKRRRSIFGRRWGYEHRGHLNRGERGALHNRLNRSSGNINRMKNNWNVDWKQFFSGW